MKLQIVHGIRTNKRVSKSRVREFDNSDDYGKIIYRSKIKYEFVCSTKTNDKIRLEKPKLYCERCRTHWCIDADPLRYSSKALKKQTRKHTNLRECDIW